MDPTWAAKLSKHNNGIDTSIASKEELEDYTATKIYEHVHENFRDFDLWMVFKEEFEDFTTDVFREMGVGIRTKLRAHLVMRGVYVAKPSTKDKYTLSDGLFDLVQEEEQHKWTDEELTDVLNGEPMNTGSLRKRLNSSKTELITNPLTRFRSPTPLARRQSPEFMTPPTSIPSQQTTVPVPSMLSNTNLQLLKSSTTVQVAHKEIATVAKIYTDEQKYSGVNDSFDYKLTIFYDICKRSGLSPEGYITAFPTMLKGHAQDHYYSSSLSSKPFADACTHMRNFFEGAEYYRKNLTEWNAINLQGIIDNNPNKGVYQSFQLLVDKLLTQRHGIHPEFRTDLFLTNKLVTACQGVPACRIAISNPCDELSQLISKIQSSIVSWEKEHPLHNTTRPSETFYTDRKYYQKGRNPSRSISNNRYNRISDRPYGRSASGSRKGKCYVCQKENCRSWKHPPEERERSREAYRSKFNADTGNNGDFEDRYRQYTVFCEGDDENEGNEAFETLILDATNQGDIFEDQDSDCFLTTFGALSASEATSTSVELANKAYTHLLTASVATVDHVIENDPFAYSSAPKSRYTSTVFMGIMIDTGASKKSTAGYEQFQALQQVDGTIKLDTSTKGQVSVQFGIGMASSIGTVEVYTPIGQVQFHVVCADTPFLLCLADMDNLHIYYNNLKDIIITRIGVVPVVRRFGHPFLLWNSALQSYLIESFATNPCYLTDVELRRLHRRFGHPSVERLQKLLYRAGHEVDSSTIDKLTKFCHYCQKHGKSPGRFRFTLKDDINFNYNVIVDVMYISGAPLLHIVDEGTRFQAGKWLQDISAKHTWDILRTCWIDTYLGPPDLITHDAGKNFISNEFKQYASVMGITTKGVPVEAHNSIGMVERYHGPIRRAYQIIATEFPDISKDMALQMAFKAINDSVGPDGLVPTLLVFGAYPRMIDSDAPSPTVAQRTTAIKKAMIEINKLRAERQIAEALNTRNGPKTDAIHGLPPSSPVLVWREGNTGQAGHWDGPFSLLTIEGETCTVELPHGPTIFRSTVVKPYYTTQEKDGKESEREQQPQPCARTVIPPHPEAKPQKRGRGRPRKYPLLTATTDITVMIQSNPEPKDTQFATSRQKELTGLLEKGVFEIVKLKDVPPGVRLFNSRFVDEIKNKGTDKAFEKSRLVVQAYNDLEKALVLTQSPTIMRVSQRLILCIAAMGNHDLYLRDISQAYVQSATNLNREFYVRPPRELSIEEDSILKVLKPLYGVPEAGNHWFKTYHSHHIDHLGMTQSTYDPCLLYNTQPFGIVGLQTDDTLILADPKFADDEEKELHKAKFLSKEREKLTADAPLKFNGAVIRLAFDGLTLTQERQCANVNIISTTRAKSTGSRGSEKDLTPKEQYIAQRARGAYIASVCQPEASFDLSFAAQVIDPTDEDAKTLNKRLQWQIENPQRGLKFVKLDIQSLQLLVFTDASFANNNDLSSQIGYVIVLTDASKKANILHWSSVKCKRVTRSVLASELYGMTHGFDISTAIKSTIDKILQVNIPLIQVTDSKSLYDCLVRLGTTQEKRLMIDVMCLRQAYERRLITEVKWIDGEANPADAMTKGKACIALQQLIDTNRIDLQAVGWVERTMD